MNIAFFADSYRPYTSGVVHSIDSFRSELTAQGHNVYIFCPGYKNYAPEPGVFRFKSLPAPTNKDFRIAIPLSLKIFSLARSLKLDIVHSHSPFLLGRLGQKVARKLDVPFVFTYHTLYEHYVHYVPFARTLSKWAVLRIAKDFCNRSDLVVVPTSIVEKMLKSAGVRTPLAVIPTGVDLTKFTRTDPGFLRSRLNLNSPHKIMLFVGRLGREKNLQFLLSCAAQIMRAEPLAVLVLVGGGPLGELLKRTADKLGVGSRTYFLGPLSQPEVINCYASADLLLFTSMTETQGLVLAEAKAAGLPVVAVRAAGAIDMVSDGEDGFLVPPEEAKVVEAALHLLRSDDLRRAMKERAITRAELFSSSRQARLLLAAYNELASMRRKEIK